MPKIDYLVSIDLNKQELLNAKLQNLATPPTLTANDKGFIYWNTADVVPYIWTGTDWLDFASMYTHPTFPGVGQPTNPLTGANVISQITLDNGHVTGVQTRAITAADIGAAASAHTHLFTDITGLPANTILGNNTATTGAAKALTIADLLTMLAIGYGSDALLLAGTDTTQRTWTAKQLVDYINSRIGSYLTVVNLSLGTRTGTTMAVNNSAGTGVTLPSASTTQAGLQSAADKTKLDGIEAGANNYVHPTLNPGAHPFVTELTAGLQVLSQMVVNNLGHVVTIKGRNLTAADLAAVLFNDAINNGTNTTWSSSKIYNEIQAAIGSAQTGALQYKGEYNATTNTPNLATDTSIKIGWTYVVTGAGTFAGQEIEAGDMIIAKVDNPGGTAGNWQIVNKNIPAIVDASTTVKGIIQLATSAEAIAGVNAVKAITPATLKAVLDATVGGYAANFGDGSSTTFTITHGLNTQDVDITVYTVVGRKKVMMETAAPSATTVSVACNVAPANGSYRVVIKK